MKAEHEYEHRFAEYDYEATVWPVKPKLTEHWDGFGDPSCGKLTSKSEPSILA